MNRFSRAGSDLPSSVAGLHGTPNFERSIACLTMKRDAAAYSKSRRPRAGSSNGPLLTGSRKSGLHSPCRTSFTSAPGVSSYRRILRRMDGDCISCWSSSASAAPRCLAGGCAGVRSGGPINFWIVFVANRLRFQSHCGSFTDCVTAKSDMRQWTVATAMIREQ